MGSGLIEPVSISYIDRSLIKNEKGGVPNSLTMTGYFFIFKGFAT